MAVVQFFIGISTRAHGGNISCTSYRVDMACLWSHSVLRTLCIQGRIGYNLIRSSYRARPDGRGWSESAAPTRCYILAFCSTDYCIDHYSSLLLHSWHKKTYKHFIQKLLGKFTARSKQNQCVCSGQPLVISLNIQYALMSRIHYTPLTPICVGCSHTRLSRIAGSALSLLARSAPFPTGLPGEAWAALI